jgi:large subunit ribosomal protein L29
MARKSATKAADTPSKADRSSAADQLRELGTDELTARLVGAKEELFNLRFQMATGQMDNNRRLRTVRHDIARVYTVMRERELGLSIGPDQVPGKEGAA